MRGKARPAMHGNGTDGEVLIVRPQEIDRVSLQAQLQSRGVPVAGAVATGAEALEFLARNPVTIVLTELSLPGEDAFALIEELDQRGVQVIVATQRCDAGSVVRAVESGAAGFLGPRCGIERHLEAIALVRRGDAWYDPEVQRFLRRRSSPPIDGTRPLRPKERELLRLRLEGLNGEALAEALDVEPNTVRAHWRNIFDALGVRDQLSAVLAALLRGELDGGVLGLVPIPPGGGR